MLLEVCVDSVDGLLEAVLGGADRIELCSALEVGGLTPSAGLISKAKEICGLSGVPIYAMIRPRAGDFAYSESEVEVMELEIDAIRQAGMAGVVFGASQPGTCKLDQEVLTRLVRRAQGIGKTLHRCFDLVPNLEEAVDITVALGFERILTSGRSARAIPDGLADLAEIVRLASGRISIMPGSGINANNVEALLGQIAGIAEVHSSCSTTNDEHIRENAKLIELGFSTGKPGKRTIPEEVRRMKEKLRSLEKQ